MKKQLEGYNQRIFNDFSRYGIDKPDTRFPYEINDITESLKDSKFSIFQSSLKQNHKIKAINIKKLAGNLNNKELESIQAEARQHKGEVIRVHSPIYQSRY